MQILFYIVGAGIAILSLLVGISMVNQISSTTWYLSYALIALIIFYAIVGILLSRRESNKSKKLKDRIETLITSNEEMRISNEKIHNEVRQYVTHLPVGFPKEEMNRAQRLIKLIEEMEKTN